MCQKSETRFFSRTCQEAMFTVIFRLILAGLELNLHRHMLSQKKTSQSRSLLQKTNEPSSENVYGLFDLRADDPEEWLIP